MKDLIEMEDERSAIEAKLKVCLSELEELEAQLNTIEQSSLMDPRGKEART
jgi:hypothetical protein